MHDVGGAAPQKAPAVQVGITKTFEIACEHQLPYHQGKCARKHGHNYKLEFTVYGPVQGGTGPDSGMVMDFGDLKAAIQAVLDRLDHYSLNDRVRVEEQGMEPLGLPSDNPTAEHLAVWLLEQLPMVHRVVVWETSTACAHAERYWDDPRRGVYFSTAQAFYEEVRRIAQEQMLAWLPKGTLDPRIARGR